MYAAPKFIARFNVQVVPDVMISELAPPFTLQWLFPATPGCPANIAGRPLPLSSFV